MDRANNNTRLTFFQLRIVLIYWRDQWACLSVQAEIPGGSIEDFAKNKPTQVRLKSNKNSNHILGETKMSSSPLQFYSPNPVTCPYGPNPSRPIQEISSMTNVVQPIQPRDLWATIHHPPEYARDDGNNKENWIPRDKWITHLSHIQSILATNQTTWWCQSPTDQWLKPESAKLCVHSSVVYTSEFRVTVVICGHIICQLLVFI